MAKQKGTKTFDFEVGKVQVVVQCDEDGGFDGTKDELQEAVAELIREEIETMTPDSNGFMVTDVTIKMMTGSDLH